jgi:hypothetical protein
MFAGPGSSSTIQELDQSGPLCGSAIRCVSIMKKYGNECCRSNGSNLATAAVKQESRAASVC